MMWLITIAAFAKPKFRLAHLTCSQYCPALEEFNMRTAGFAHTRQLDRLHPRHVTAATHTHRFTAH